MKRLWVLVLLIAVVGCGGYPRRAVPGRDFIPLRAGYDYIPPTWKHCGSRGVR